MYIHQYIVHETCMSTTVYNSRDNLMLEYVPARENLITMYTSFYRYMPVSYVMSYSLYIFVHNGILSQLKPFLTPLCYLVFLSFTLNHIVSV